MAVAKKYQQGQRWRLGSSVSGFESTLVIAHVQEANPERGPTFSESHYHVYVRYDSHSGTWVPPEKDGCVLSLNAAGLDCSVTRLIESGIELPWWWKHGRRFENESDAPNTICILESQNVAASLPILLAQERQYYDYHQRKAIARQKHRQRKKAGTKRSAPSRSVAESWTRIEAWVKQYAPEYALALNPGASDSEIAEFEEAIGAQLPDDFKESVRIHDGGGWWVLPNYGEFLSLNGILQLWRTHRAWQEEGTYADGSSDFNTPELTGPIKRVFWNLRRIFFTDNSGDHLTLDPPRRGKYGQIVHHSHEVGPIRVVARSWEEFLQRLLADLEGDKYVYDDTDGTLERQEE